MVKFNKCIYTLDLIVLIAAALLSAVFILVPPFNNFPIKIIFIIVLVFFIPGYAFICTLFPRKNEISITERSALSIGFSILVIAIDGFLISQTEWKFRPYPVTLSLILITLVFVITAYISRKNIPEDQQYCISLKDLSKQIQLENEKLIYFKDNEKLKESTYKKFAATNRKKISKYKNRKYLDQTKLSINENNEISHKLAKTLIITTILALIMTGSMFAYAKVTREKESFTAIYILGPDGKADNYPSTVSTSSPINLIVGVENHEYSTVNYTMKIKFNDLILEELQITCMNEEKLEKRLSITPSEISVGQQKLEILLYKENELETPYRSVHLWLTPEIGSDDLHNMDTSEQNEETTSIDFIDVINPSMELDTGWKLMSSNKSAVSGNYQYKGIYSSRGYVISSKLSGTISESADYSIQQIIHSDKTEEVILSAFLKDNFTKIILNKDETQYKQVIFNGQIIWTDGMSRDEGWQHLQIPVTILKGNNTLSFNIVRDSGLTAYPVELIVDEVSFITLSEVSPYRNDDYTVEFDLPVSKVLPLPLGTKESQFIVQWNGTDEGSGILYYDIEYSTDGSTWSTLLSKTTAQSIEFTAKEGIRYYFRSRATDKAFNVEETHPIADTSTMIDEIAPEITFDITPNPASESTYFTVESSEKLANVICTVTSKTFGTVEKIEMKSNDNLIWKADYTVDINDEYNVEIYVEDFANNSASTFDTLYTDSSLEELLVIIEPEETSGDTTVKISSSIALKEEPSIIVKDRSGTEIETNFETVDDNEYTYTVDIDKDDEDISDGVARVIVTAKGTNSISLYEEETFIIDRTEPDITSFTPADKASISTNSPAIRVSFSDSMSGIEKAATIIKVNGVDVTNDAELDYGSVLYISENLPNGENRVYISIKDQAGNTYDDEWVFYIV